jgi:septum formation protein
LNNNFTSKTFRPLVLASTSRYRAELLARLKIPFSQISPDTDETAKLDENCQEIALRLAVAKAWAGVALFKQQNEANAGLVIGSDQVAELNGKALGKPGTRANAFNQLQQMRGQMIIFHTALALIDIASSRIQTKIVETTVMMREYSDAQINYYLDHENALDCAGSAKSEGLGAALIASMTSDDPTALVGLPLLALVDMLANEGVEILA